MFKFSKVEKDKFKYLGCEIQQVQNGDITLNQNQYITNILEVDYPSGLNSSPVNEVGRK